MNIAIVLALGALLAGAFADLIYRGAQIRGINSTTFVFYQATVFSLVLWSFSFSTGQMAHAVPATWLFGLPGGLLAFAGILLFVMSLKQGKASVFVPIFRLSFVITALGAIVVLGEPLTIPKLVGVVLAVAGILSLADLRSLLSGSVGERRSLLYVLAATVAFGTAFILNKEATNQGSPTIPLITVSNFTFYGAAFLTVLLARQIKPNKTTLWFAPLVGLLQLTFTILLLQSFQTGDASITSPIAQLSFVLTAILAVIVYREAVHRRLVLGLAAATLAVVVFAFA